MLKIFHCVDTAKILIVPEELQTADNLRVIDKVFRGTINDQISEEDYAIFTELMSSPKIWYG